MDDCKICGNKSNETHHIKPQKDADQNNVIGHHHKNKSHNLIPLCKSCHNDVTHERLIIRGYLETNEGLKLDYEYVEKKKTNKKYTEEQINIILGYKKDIDDKEYTKTYLIKILDVHGVIKI